MPVNYSNIRLCLCCLPFLLAACKQNQPAATAADLSATVSVAVPTLSSKERALILKHIVQLPSGKEDFEDKGAEGVFLKNTSDGDIDTITDSFLRFTTDLSGTAGVYKNSSLYWLLPSAQGTTTILELSQNVEWLKLVSSEEREEIAEEAATEWEAAFAKKNPNRSPNEQEIDQKEAYISSQMEARLNELGEEARKNSNLDWFAGTSLEISIKIWQKQAAGTFQLINAQALPENFQQLVDNKFKFDEGAETNATTPFKLLLNPSDLDIKKPLVKQIFGFGATPPKEPIPLTENTYQPFNYDLTTQTLRLRFCETYGLDLRWNGLKFELL